MCGEYYINGMCVIYLHAAILGEIKKKKTNVTILNFSKLVLNKINMKYVNDSFLLPNNFIIPTTS